MEFLFFFKKKGDLGQRNPDPKQNFQAILLTFTVKKHHQFS